MSVVFSADAVPQDAGDAAHLAQLPALRGVDRYYLDGGADLSGVFLQLLRRLQEGSR